MSAYFKDITREIKKSIGRFISLLIITALGASSVVGIQATSIDMRMTADKTYKEKNLYDVQIKSTVGFSDDDILNLQNIPGVHIVMPAYIYDVYIFFENETKTARTYALPDELNKIELLEGRLPENIKECVVEKQLLNREKYKIGDTISLGLDDMDDYYDIFDNNEFTIVGAVSSPLYINLYDRGNTNLGDGRLNYYLYVYPDVYQLDVYTDVYILMDGSQNIDNLTDEYFDFAGEWKDQIKLTGDIRVQVKKDEFSDMQKEIDEKRSMLENSPVKLPEMFKELDKAQEKLNNAPTPEWFYFTRKDGLSYESYYQDTLKLKQIGYVFPVVFFLVAILVSLTTMSRMVEEHRTQIGIYKALGYKPVKIIMKYMIYAFFASAPGGISGVVAGSNIFPRVIADAYRHLYKIPPLDTPVPPFISSIAVVSAVGAVLTVTLFTCIKAMHGAPAELMRPKSPPAGKRVLIERFPFIWNRFDFISKVTARNIFRYKKRFIMTLFGVAGCTALLITAFGLRDSVGCIGELQYDKIVKYNSKAYIKEITAPEQKNELDSLLVGDYLYIREESAEVKNNDANFSASLIIPEKSKNFNDFIHLRSHTTGEPVPFDGILLTEKLAREIGVSTGDYFTIITSGEKTYTTKVSGIVENYILHFIYMPPDIYEELFGIKPSFNSILMNDTEQGLAEKLLANDLVRAVVSSEDMKKNITDSADALQIVAVVLIVLACMLAFVVLFNLTNINITERIRELATIKVLGFYDSELAMYIYRENGIVTIMGIILGIFGGIFLNRYVLIAAEVDLLMFPHIIKFQSYILSVALSIVFALFVNWAMNFKLKAIDMVESLKNVE